MNLPKYSKGFTLVELLVTMSIIAIITGGIVPSFTGYIKNQNLKQAQEQFKSDLRTIQNRALTGAFSDRQLSGSYVSYWGALFTAGSGTSVEYFISVDNSCPPNYASTAEFQGTFTLPNDIKYYIALTPIQTRCMFFDIRNGDIITEITIPITLKYEESGSGVDINFRPSGLIWTEVGN
ncbi:type II secretion system GspH family protein [Patescibacteria group bacterium]|nr:type II secretion system GspH family protein [Patescibacteria group bacterium]